MKNKNAFVLSIVLWIVVAILLISTSIIYFSKENIYFSKNLYNKLQARLVAESILEELKFYIATTKFDSISFINTGHIIEPYHLPKKLILDGRWYIINKDINISLTDTSALLNIKGYGIRLLSDIIIKEKDRFTKEIFYNSTKDWIDKDSITRLNGAESTYYKSIKGVKYLPRNIDAIQNYKELSLIRGYNKLSKLKKEFIENYTYYGFGSYQNIALINKYILSTILKISLVEAEDLILLRDKDLRKFIKTISSYKNYDSDSMGFAISKQILIKINAKIVNSKVFLEALINFRPKNHKLITVIKYKVK